MDYGVNTILLSGLLGLCNASVGTMHATYLDVSNMSRSFGTLHHLNHTNQLSNFLVGSFAANVTLRMHRVACGHSRVA